MRPSVFSYSNIKVTVMDKDKIIEKIQKLLAKTEENGASAAEAASAIALAQKLMAQYGVSVEETEIVSSNEIIEDEFSVGTKSVSSFQVILAANLAPHFACRVVKRVRRSGFESLLFIGERYKTLTFKECFAFAYQTYVKLSAKYLQSSALSDYSRSMKSQVRWDYFNGFVEGLTNELIKSENENALVIVESPELKEHMDEMNLRTFQANRRPTESFSHSLRGYTDGSFAYRNKNKALDE